MHAEPTRRGAIRHLPNALTALRLIAIPFFIVLLWDAPDGHSVAAGLLFGFASVTDWFDGYLARRLDVSTRFGRLADPLADRLLIASAVILLYHHDRVPLVALLLILGRDLLLISGLTLAADRGYELSVIYLGKTATFVLMGALGLIMLTEPGAVIPDLLLYIGIALSLAAGAVYAVTVGRRLRARGA
jgi:CDP-diacylglycerol--glycerol-3-phosphate 3-phosphatidyltransferase